MRVLRASVLLVVVGVLVVPSNTEGTGPTLNPRTTFWEKNSNVNAMMEMMQMYFSNSLKELVMGKHFNSQYIQKPGMGNQLMEFSNSHWEEGMNVLKKYLQRGGTTSHQHFSSHFKFEGEGLNGDAGVDALYLSTLGMMMGDAKERMAKMNHLTHHAGKDVLGDAEMIHYLEDKLEKEAEVVREMVGHHVTLSKMKEWGLALNIFDSNL